MDVIYTSVLPANFLRKEMPAMQGTPILLGDTTDDKNELKNQTPLNRLGTPEDIANMAYFLASDDADFVTGQVITVDGGFTL